MCLDSWYVGDPIHEKRGLSWTSGLWITVLLQISLISLYYAYFYTYVHSSSLLSKILDHRSMNQQVQHIHSITTDQRNPHH